VRDAPIGRRRADMVFAPVPAEAAKQWLAGVRSPVV
jgi:hypothetical protein